MTFAFILYCTLLYHSLLQKMKKRREEEKNVEFKTLHDCKMNISYTYTHMNIIIIYKTILGTV